MLRADDPDAPRGIPSRIPPATAIIVTICVFAAAVQEIRPDWLLLAARDPSRFAHGEWWRVITSLFAFDDGPVQKLGTVFAALALGLLAERRFGMAEWLIIAFASGLTASIVGAGLGLAWDPTGASPSPAVAGLLGATAVWLAWPAARREDAQSAVLAIALGRLGIGDRAFPVLARLAAALVAVLMVVLLAWGDIHGIAIFVGAAYAVLTFLRPSAG